MQPWRQPGGGGLHIIALLQTAVIALALPGPIGSFPGCAPGTTNAITCYASGYGPYIAEIEYSNSQVPGSLSLCNSDAETLFLLSATTLTLADDEFVTSVTACSDSIGLRGIALRTNLKPNRQTELTCGRPAGSCITYTGGGAPALGGFYGSCRQVPFRQAHVQVAQVHSVCWNPNYIHPGIPLCFPGFGIAGVGRPCVVCQPGYFSPGGPGQACLPCPDGLTTTQQGQSQCGCLPGQGLNLTEWQPACRRCPAGTWSAGGSLAPCCHCPGKLLTSPPGSTSVGDCTCKAGYGATVDNPTECTICPQNYFSTGGVASPARSGNATASTQDRRRPSTSGRSRRWRSDGGSRGRGGTSSSRQPAPPPARSTKRRAAADAPAAPAAAVLPAHAAQEAAAQQHIVLQLQLQAAAHVANSGNETCGFAEGTGSGVVHLHSSAELQQGSRSAMPGTAAAGSRVLAGLRPATNGDFPSQGGPPATGPTLQACSPCGAGCTTEAEGATSPNNCTCAAERGPVLPRCATPLCNSTTAQQAYNSCNSTGSTTVPLPRHCIAATDTTLRFNTSTTAAQGLLTVDGSLNCSGASSTNRSAMNITVVAVGAKCRESLAGGLLLNVTLPSSSGAAADASPGEPDAGADSGEEAEGGEGDSADGGDAYDGDNRGDDYGHGEDSSSSAGGLQQRQRQHKQEVAIAG